MENMMENFAPIIQAIKGKNPQQLVMQMLGRQPINNPLVAQLINCAKSGDNTTMLNLANNYFSQRGINIDINKEFQAFMSMLNN